MKQNFIISSFIIFIYMVGSSTTSSDREVIEKFKEDGIQNSVIIPFANHTRYLKAVRAVMPELDVQLYKHQFFNINDKELRDFLRRNRIRAFGTVNKNQAAKITSEIDISYLIFGSIDIFEEGTIPELALSVRILDAATMDILWAASGSATGADRRGLFDLGEITHIDTLTKQVLKEIFKDFLINAEGENTSINNLQPRVVIIPFENHSDYRYAGNIISNILISELFKLGIEVVEPGMVDEFFVEMQVIPRGEIDLNTLSDIASSYEPDYVITGAIDKFKLSRADIRTSSPEIEMSLRILDAKTGAILDINSVEKNGNDYEKVFGLGKIHSLGKLASRQIQKMLRSSILFTNKK